MMVLVTLPFLILLRSWVGPMPGIIFGLTGHRTVMSNDELEKFFCSLDWINCVGPRFDQT